MKSKIPDQEICICPNCQHVFSLLKIKLDTIPESKILELVAEITGISLEVQKSKVRTKDIALARFLSMTFLRKYSGLYVTKIAKIFNRDHTSVLYSLNAITGWIQTEREVRLQYYTIEEHCMKYLEGYQKQKAKI
jgi:chromosomal replication initiation ATPase DnaA